MLPYKRQYFSVNNFQKSKPKNDKHDRGKNDYGDSNLNNKNYSNCPNSQIRLRSYSIMIITECSTASWNVREKAGESSKQNGSIKVGRQ